MSTFFIRRAAVAIVVLGSVAVGCATSTSGTSVTLLDASTGHDAAGSGEVDGGEDATNDGQGDEVADATTDSLRGDDGSGDDAADAVTDGPGDGGSPSCTPQDTQCSGNGVQICNGAGQWGAAMDCGS